MRKGRCGEFCTPDRLTTFEEEEEEITDCLELAEEGMEEGMDDVEGFGEGTSGRVLMLGILLGVRDDVFVSPELEDEVTLRGPREGRCGDCD